jgi:hypothetical protein
MRQIKRIEMVDAWT